MTTRWKHPGTQTKTPCHTYCADRSDPGAKSAADRNGAKQNLVPAGDGDCAKAQLRLACTLDDQMPQQIAAKLLQLAKHGDCR